MVLSTTKEMQKYCVPTKIIFYVYITNIIVNMILLNITVHFHNIAYCTFYICKIHILST